MKKLFILILILVLSSGFLLFKLFVPEFATAGVLDNVSGFAWSENIGWISFNSTSGGGGTDYGVNIETDGSFTGYAWSENIGWIDFSGVSVDMGTGELSGWASALSAEGGWDGQISMSGTSPDYGVVIDTGTGIFSGFAWGDDVVGWVNFSDVTYQVQTSFSFNTDPVVSNLSVDQGDYCVLAFQPTFYWDYTDAESDPQNSYQVQIDDDGDIGTDPIIDSCFPDPGTCAPGNTAQSYSPASPSAFDHNTTYYWRVRASDDRGGQSDWVSSQFTTPVHKYPGPNFEWLPLRPSQGEFVQFCSTAEVDVCASDISDCYAIGGAQISCSGNSFTWTFPVGTEFSDTTSAISENPEVKLNNTGWQNVSLNINDGVGSCVNTVSIRISGPLPKYKEIAP